MSFDAAEDPAVLGPAKEGDGLRFARVEVPTSQGPSQGGGPPRVTATAQCDLRPKFLDGLRFGFSFRRVSGALA